MLFITYYHYKYIQRKLKLNIRVNKSNININQMDKNFVNYEMIKSNSIEFAFLSKQFGNYIKFEDSIIEKIYVSVHSSQSIFRTEDFQPINIMFNKNNSIISY